jgi:hypothetical protein
MPDPQHLDAARQHLAEANKILMSRPYAERGSAASEAALLLARAQAEATLSIAGMLADGVRLSLQAEGAMEDFNDHLGAFTSVVRQLTGRLDDFGG